MEGAITAISQLLERAAMAGTAWRRKKLMLNTCTRPTATLTKAIAAPTGCYKLAGIASVWQGSFALRRWKSDYKLMLIGAGIEMQDLKKGDRFALDFGVGETLGVTVDRVLVVRFGDAIVIASEN
jgi:hypothetical protein